MALSDDVRKRVVEAVVETPDWSIFSARWAAIWGMLG